MARAFVSCLLVLVMATSAAAAAAPTSTHPDVVKGIKQVEDGEYDAAIVTLDTAVRRLQSGGAASKDLAHAYLYLGIAYVGKGQETAAKARFRDALAQAGDMNLSADKFAPKIIEIFEKAKDESRGSKGGSGKGLLIGGGVAAAAGATALVLAGGGGDGGPSGGTQTTTGTVGGSAGESSFLVVTPTKTGTLEATVTWQNPNVQLSVGCHENDPPYTNCEGQLTRPNATTATLRTSVQQKPYLMAVSNFQATAEAFTLTVRLP